MDERDLRDTSPDERLVRRCLRDDRDAWETLVRRYSSLVYGIASKAGLGEDDRADVFQEVFVVIWRNLGTLQEPGALVGWIATIARREAWRVSRRVRRRSEDRESAGEDPAIDRLLPDAPAADAAMERAQRAFLVGRAIDAIDERCRRLLEMLFFERPTPSYDRVAERLDVPVGSVGPTRGRCLEKLRRALRDLGLGEDS